LKQILAEILSWKLKSMFFTWIGANVINFEKKRVYPVVQEKEPENDNLHCMKRDD
jgi:hypothetical protein